MLITKNIMQLLETEKLSYIPQNQPAMAISRRGALKLGPEFMSHIWIEVVQYLCKKHMDNK